MLFLKGIDISSHIQINHMDFVCYNTYLTQKKFDNTISLQKILPTKDNAESAKAVLVDAVDTELAIKRFSKILFSISSWEENYQFLKALSL